MIIPALDDPRIVEWEKRVMQSLCCACLHFKGATPKAIFTCQAFPDGIPDEIALGEIEHRVPVEGDHGLRFQGIHEQPGELE